MWVQAGADPDAKDDSGTKPIMAAAATGCREVVETLLPLTQAVAGLEEWSAVAIMDSQAPVPDVGALSLEGGGQEQVPWGGACAEGR